MLRFQLAYSMIRPALGVAMLLAALLVLMLGGCAATPGNALTASSGNPLASRLDDQIRRLTMRCYWDNDGMRYVYGGMPVFTACRDWARAQVKVRMSASTVASMD